jgi:hypothetical protein
MRVKKLYGYIRSDEYWSKEGIRVRMIVEVGEKNVDGCLNSERERERERRERESEIRKKQTSSTGAGVSLCGKKGTGTRVGRDTRAVE